MKLTRDAAFRLFKTIEDINSKIYNKYFLYSIFSNKKILIPLVDEVSQKSREIYSDKFREFQKKYDLIKYDDNDAKEKYDALISEYSDTLKEINDKELIFKDWIMEEIELDLKTIEFVQIPEEIDAKLYTELSIIFMDP